MGVELGLLEWEGKGEAMIALMKREKRGRLIVGRWIPESDGQVKVVPIKLAYTGILILILARQA